jgi:hypothetical protein
MRWIRRRTRSQTWLALFALAVQLVVSFGHVHRDDLGLAFLAADSAVITPIGPGLTHSPTVPDRGHNPTSDALCPICASINLAGALILPLPPQLDALMQVGRVWLPVARTNGLSDQARLSFQARAPPVA